MIHRSHLFQLGFAAIQSATNSTPLRHFSPAVKYIAHLNLMDVPRKAFTKLYSKCVMALNELSRIAMNITCRNEIMNLDFVFPDTLKGYINN